jgi:alpha-glucosidase
MTPPNESTTRRSVLVGMGAVAASLGACSSLAPAQQEKSNALTARSPNAALSVRILIEANDDSALQWEILRDGKRVIEPSAIGLVLADGTRLGPRVKLVGHAKSVVDGSWSPPYGIRAQVSATCEELIVRVQDAASGIVFDCIVRAYDAGATLRYRIREHSGATELALAGELTEFRLPRSARVYASRDEGEYQIAAPQALAPTPHPDLTSSCDPEPLADLPVTIALRNGLTAVIAESDRLHYPRAMLLAAPDGSACLVTHLMRYPGRATGYSGPGDTPPAPTFKVPLPFATPWRVVMVEAKPAALIEQADFIPTLATANVLGDPSWIRTGRAIRSFRDNTTAAGLACIDFAVRHKLEYIEFDAHWYGDGTDASDATVPIPGLDMQQVIRYGKERNVDVIVYVDRVPVMRQLDDIVRTYQSWGIAGIKFGFVWEGRQEDTDFLYEVIRKCGEHRLFVLLHDNLRPAGLERTLPNYLTLEGVRGNEQFPTARHNVTLPFTRNVAGPIDYTICYAQERNQTTNAHQLAMAVVYYSPLVFLYWYDKPDKYAQREWPDLEWFVECPTVWDETRALSGAIGEYVVVARRRQDRWFIGAMTNETARTLEVPLSFLAPGEWTAAIYSDGEPATPANATPVNIQHASVNSSTILHAKLAPHGGQAIRLERVR